MDMTQASPQNGSSTAANALPIVTVSRLPFPKTNATFGIIDLEGVPLMLGLELPWKNNAEGVSCVPPGEYFADRVFSNHFQTETFKLRDVPGRSDCEFHWGNTVEAILGCVLTGTSMGVFKGEKTGKYFFGVGGSKDAFVLFMSRLTGIRLFTPRASHWPVRRWCSRCGKTSEQSSRAATRSSSPALVMP